MTLLWDGTTTFSTSAHGKEMWAVLNEITTRSVTRAAAIPEFEICNHKKSGNEDSLEALPL
jgi:hypothetical protein